MSLKTCHKACAVVLCMAFGMICAISFSVNIVGYVGLGAVPAATTSYLWTALGICFALLFWHSYVRLKLQIHITEALLGLVFGLLNSFCSVLFAVDSLQMSTAALLLTIGKGVFQGIPMMTALSLIHYYMSSGVLAEKRHENNRPEYWIDRHPVWPFAAVLFVCWLPYLVVFFPGTVCWDLGEMVAAFFGQRRMDTMHPVFVTYLLGGCIWVGRLIGSDNIGTVLYTLLQTAAFAWALASVVALCRTLKVRRAVWISILAFFGLTPIFGGYAQFVSTDTLYTAALTLFTVHTVRLLLSVKGVLQENLVVNGIRLFAWGLLACLMRLNGFAVIAVSAGVLTLTLLCGNSLKKAGYAIAGMALCLLLTLGFNKLLVPSLGIVDNTASGIYSVCFQQSARILRDHGNTITPDEYAAIDAVLDADRLPELYDTAVSDPVKYTFRQWGKGPQTEKAALATYRTAWFNMAKKYSLTCLEAFVAGNMSYYTFQPKIDGETYNNQGGARLVFETYSLGDDPRFLHTRQPDLFYSARIILAALARGGRHIPGVSLLYCCAFYTWLAVALAVSMYHQRKGRLLCAFVPILATFACCIFSPVNDYFRYFLPVVTMIPLLFCTAVKTEQD